MKVTFQKVWTYIIALLMAYTAGTVVSSYYYTKMILLVVAFAMFSVLIKYRVRYKVVCIFVSCVFFVMFTQVINWDRDLSTGISILLMILSGVLLSNSIEKRQFADALFNIMVLFAGVSIVLYVIGRINPAFPRSLPEFHGYTTNNNFGYIFFYPAGINISNSVLRRNQSIYREMGVFANILIWSLGLKLLEEEKISITKLGIILLAIGTTFSTSGLLAVLFLIPLLIDKISKPHTLKRYMIYGAAFVVAAIFLYHNRVLVFSKFIKSHGDYGSFALRYDGTIQDLKIFLDNIFGAGITKYEILGVGTANAITYTLAVFGLGVAVILFLGFLLSFWNRRRSFFKNICVEIAILIVLLTQNSTTFPLFYMIAMYGYMRETKINGKKIKNCNNQLYL